MNNRRKIIIGVITLLIIMVGYWQYSNAGQRAYDAGWEAHQESDCQTALQHYDRVTTVYRYTFSPILDTAEIRTRECDFFLSANYALKRVDYDLAIDNYIAVLHGGSVLAYSRGEIPEDPREGRPELPPAPKIQVATITALYEIANQFLSEKKYCNEPIEIFTQILWSDTLFVDEVNAVFPQVILNCGLTSFESGNYPWAILSFEALIGSYPDSPLAREAQALLVDARVEEFRNQEMAELPQFQVSGSAEMSTAVVLIKNDSPERLEILFSGPDSQATIIEKCPHCRVYQGVPPTFCPTVITEDKVTLMPGNYEIVARAMDNPLIIPWSGSQLLSGGTEYSNCFFIVINPSP